MSTKIPHGGNLSDNRGPEAIRPTVSCASLAGLILTGRLVSRKLQKQDFKISDVLGLLGAWTACGLAVWGKSYLMIHFDIRSILNDYRCQIGHW